MSYLEKMFSIEGKTAVITGAKRGIGYAIATAFQKAGANVIGVDKLPITDAPFTSYRCNIEDEEEISKFVKYCNDTCDTIDILVNNAGVGFGHKFLDYPLED